MLHQNLLLLQSVCFTTFSFIVGQDFASQSITISFLDNFNLGSVRTNNDMVWEGIEDFIFAVSFDDKNYNRTIFILDRTGGLW